MQIQPASIDQVMQGADGRMVIVDADAGMVADDLRRIDPTLGVRFAENGNPPFFAVYCQPNDRETYLVFTVRAYQNHFGVWEGLDQRVVREIERIGAEDYDYVAEVEAKNLAAERAKRQRIRDELEVASYEAYRQLRKIIGRNCNFMSVPKGIAA